MTEDDRKPGDEPKLRVDPEALGRAFVKALEEAAEEEASMPKRFEKGEGMLWPLAD